MSDSDLIDLYSGRILELAADIPLVGRLDAPQASVRKRAPLCGSAVTVDLDAQDGRITRYSHDVRACALGQAAASVIGQVVIGRSRDEILRGRDELRAMLKDGGPAPSPPFEELGVLMPARGFRNRHDSILLTFDAIAEAMEGLEKSRSA